MNTTQSALAICTVVEHNLIGEVIDSDYANYEATSWLGLYTMSELAIGAILAEANAAVSEWNADLALDPDTTDKPMRHWTREDVRVTRAGHDLTNGRLYRIDLMNGDETYEMTYWEIVEHTTYIHP